MATTKKEISDWFDAGIKQGATHMIVVCDTWDYEDYPVYVMPGQSVIYESNKRHWQNMQKVMEVYSMSLDKESQMAEHRAFHYD